MASLLQQLENNEAVLLMYLADELPGEDHLEVEQLLSTDAGLRAGLEQLRAAQEAVFAGLGTLDLGPGRAGYAPAAARQVGREVARWHARRHSRPAAAAPARRPLRIPRWAYPSAAAAMLLLGLLTWLAGAGDRLDSKSTAVRVDKLNEVEEQLEQLADMGNPAKDVTNLFDSDEK